MQLDPAGSCRRLMQEARRPRSGPSIALPIALLLLFAIAVGAVNFARWGNSFTFVDFRYYYWGLPARQFSRYPAKFRRNQPRPNVDRGIVLWDGHSIPAEGSASVHRILTQPDCGNRSAAVLAIPDQPAYDFPRRDQPLPPVVEALASPPSRGDPSTRARRPHFRRAPDPLCHVSHDALPLRFRTLYDHRGAH